MKQRSLSSLGEAGLLRLLTSRWEKNSARVLSGSGDDCAVLRIGGEQVLFKTDAVVEGVHFLADAPARLIGRKALARALSDIAAMGGCPLAAVVTLGFPKEESPRRLADIYRGLEQLAAKYQVHLVGGETTRAAQLFVNIALLGEMRGVAPVLRSGAASGDFIFVTGSLGGTQRIRHLRFDPRLAEGRWLAENKFATAMMDLSDGLGADLPRLGAASDLAFDVDFAAIPRTRGETLELALNEGEDYELLFTVKAARAEELKKMWPFPVSLHCIGTMRAGRPSAFAHGFDHFKQRPGRPGLRRKLGR